MNRAHLLVSGLVAIVSLSATPALARGYSSWKVKSNPKHLKLRGYEARARFDKALETRVLELINYVRYNKGLPEMRADFRAQGAARALASEAGREGGFYNIRFGLKQRLHSQGLSIKDRALGEVRAIAEEGNLENLALRIVKSWLRSPRKAKVLLSNELSYGGIGAYVRNGKVTVVLNSFGSERFVVEPPQVGDCGNSYY